MIFKIENVSENIIEVISIEDAKHIELLEWFFIDQWIASISNNKL